MYKEDPDTKIRPRKNILYGTPHIIRVIWFFVEWTSKK